MAWPSQGRQQWPFRAELLTQLFSECFLKPHLLGTEEDQRDHFIQPYLVTSLTDKTSEYTDLPNLHVKSWLSQKIPWGPC